jgi:hypothetical protein
MKTLSLLCLAALLGGCADEPRVMSDAESARIYKEMEKEWQAKARREVMTAVRIGIPIDEAKSHLERLAFGCDFADKRRQPFLRCYRPMCDM